jgi:hypothetical protein
MEPDSSSRQAMLAVAIFAISTQQFLISTIRERAYESDQRTRSRSSLP